MNTILNLTQCFVVTPLSASYIYCISYDVYNVYVSKQSSYPRPFSYKLLVNPDGSFKTIKKYSKGVCGKKKFKEKWNFNVCSKR